MNQIEGKKVAQMIFLASDFIPILIDADQVWQI